MWVDMQVRMTCKEQKFCGPRKACCKRHGNKPELSYPESSLTLRRKDSDGDTEGTPGWVWAVGSVLLSTLEDEGLRV